MDVTRRGLRMQSSSSRSSSSSRNKNLSSARWFDEQYERSISEPGRFWEAIAEDFVWQRKWDQPVLDYNFNISKGPIWQTWFAGGKTNMCYNCVDRWLPQYANTVAFYFEGNNDNDDDDESSADHDSDGSDDRFTMTYGELHTEVVRLAATLRHDYGVEKGDRVSIFLPMIHLGPVAMLACARIGAVSSVVFGGLSPTALAARLVDAGTSVLITADVSRRGNKTIPLYRMANEALRIAAAAAPSAATAATKKGGSGGRGGGASTSIKCIVYRTRTHSNSNVEHQQPHQQQDRQQQLLDPERDAWYDDDIKAKTSRKNKDSKPKEPSIPILSVGDKNDNAKHSAANNSKLKGDQDHIEWVDAEDPLFILYTSGSTGQPKALVHTTGGYMVYAATTFKNSFDYHHHHHHHRHHSDGVDGGGSSSSSSLIEGRDEKNKDEKNNQFHHNDDNDNNDVFFSTADIGWITGHTYGVFGPLLNRATSVMFEGIPTYPDPSRLWRIVDRYHVTQLYTAPTLIRMLMRAGDAWLASTSRRTLRVLGSVGEPIDVKAWRWYHDRVGRDGRAEVVDTWWQTETGGHCIAPLPMGRGWRGDDNGNGGGGRRTAATSATPLGGDSDVDSRSEMMMKPGSAGSPCFGIKAAVMDPFSGEKLPLPKLLSSEQPEPEEAEEGEVEDEEDEHDEEEGSPRRNRRGRGSSSATAGLTEPEEEAEEDEVEDDDEEEEGLPRRNRRGTGSSSATTGVKDEEEEEEGSPRRGRGSSSATTEGETVEGVLCIEQPWPGQARTIYGDHKRYEQLYFQPFPGYYFSGDGCRRDADGHYWMTGRVDDVISVSGHRIGAGEVEDAVNRHPMVVESAVVGVPDDIRGELIYAFVIFKDFNDFKNLDDDEGGVGGIGGVMGDRKNIIKDDDDDDGSGAKKKKKREQEQELEEDEVTHRRLRLLRLTREVKQTVKQIIGSLAVPAVVQPVHALPKTRSGKTVRRLLRKIVSLARSSSSNSRDGGSTSASTSPSSSFSSFSGASSSSSHHQKEQRDDGRRGDVSSPWPADADIGDISSLVNPSVIGELWASTLATATATTTASETVVVQRKEKEEGGEKGVDGGGIISSRQEEEEQAEEEKEVKQKEEKVEEAVDKEELQPHDSHKRVEVSSTSKMTTVDVEKERFFVGTAFDGGDHTKCRQYPHHYHPDPSHQHHHPLMLLTAVSATAQTYGPTAVSSSSSISTTTSAITMAGRMMHSSVILPLLLMMIMTIVSTAAALYAVIGGGAPAAVAAQRSRRRRRS